MTDLRKIVTPLNAPTTQILTNRVKSPEGDREVMYNSLGLLELDNPLIYGATRTVFTVTSADNAKQNSGVPILGGTFFSANATLNPSDLDFRRRFIISSGVAGSITLVFPDPGGVNGLIPYLKSTYGAENILPGLCWDITFINDTGGAANEVIIRINPPASASNTVTSRGFISNANTLTTTISGSSGTGAIGSGEKFSKTITFIVSSTITGSEGMTYICHD